MSNYNAKNDKVLGRQLKVQRLEIPFVIVGNATASLVSISCDEPAILKLKTEGVDQITAALDSADGTPSFTAANDANGIFNLMVDLVDESVGKVMSARVVGRTAAKDFICTLADTDGITAGGDKIVLDCDGDVALNASNTLNACLVVTYVVAE